MADFEERRAKYLSKLRQGMQYCNGLITETAHISEEEFQSLCNLCLERALRHNGFKFAAGKATSFIWKDEQTMFEWFAAPTVTSLEPVTLPIASAMSHISITQDPNAVQLLIVAFGSNVSDMQPAFYVEVGVPPAQ